MLKLFDYQRAIVERCANTDANALFMGMGTGKTVTSLELSKTKPIKKIMVICLKSKIDEWKRDIASQTGIEDFVVVNFESVWRKERYIDFVDKDTFVIVDESHKIKSWSSKVGKYMLRLSKKTPYKVILTGTPQSKGYIDLFMQLRFLGWLNMNVTQFKNRYCIYQKVTDRFDNELFPMLVGYKNTEEIDRLLDRAIYFERTIDYGDLPRDIYTDIKPSNILKFIKKNHYYGDDIFDTPLLLNMAKRQNTHHKKADAFKDILDSAEGQRVVVFYNFINEKEQLIEILTSKKRSYTVYDSTETSLQPFKDNEDGVILLNYKNGSTGINDLVLTNICVFYSPTNVYIDYEQARKRIDRIGQTKAPLYIHLLCDIEYAIMEAMKEGRDFDMNMKEGRLGTI